MTFYREIEENGNRNQGDSRDVAEPRRPIGERVLPAVGVLTAIR